MVAPTVSPPPRFDLKKKIYAAVRGGGVGGRSKGIKLAVIKHVPHRIVTTHALIVATMFKKYPRTVATHMLIAATMLRTHQVHTVTGILHALIDLLL